METDCEESLYLLIYAASLAEQYGMTMKDFANFCFQRDDIQSINDMCQALETKFKLDGMTRLK